MYRWIILGIMLLGIYSKGYPQDEVFHLKETTCEEFLAHCSQISEELKLTHEENSDFCTFIDEILDNGTIQDNEILSFNSILSTNQIKTFSLFLQTKADVKNFGINNISSLTPSGDIHSEIAYVNDSLDCRRLLYRIEVTHASMAQFRTNCNAMYQLTFGWQESCQHLDPPNEKCSQYGQFFDDLLQHGSFFQSGVSLYIVSTCVPEEFVLPCIEFVKEYLDVEQIDPEKFEEGVQKLFSFME